MEYFKNAPLQSISKTLDEFKIFNPNDGSVIRMFSESIDKELGTLQETLIEVQNSIHLTSATGKNLEDHLEPFNIYREQTSNPTFSLKIEITGDYLPSALTTNSGGIIIPASSAVAIGSDGSNILVAECLNDIYFGPNDKSVYATFLLDATTVQDKIIPSKSFTAFQSDLKTGLDNIKPTMVDEFEITCTNPENITVKITGETDQELLIRSVNTIRSTTDRTQLAVETALSVIPGILAVEFIKNKIGIGTAAIILTVANIYEMESIYDAAQAIINDIADDSLILVMPTFIDVEIHNKCVIKNSATSEQISAFKTDVIERQMQLINQTITGKGIDVASQLNSIVTESSIVESSSVSCIKLDGVPMDNLKEIKAAWDEKLITTIVDAIPPIKFVN